MWQWFSAKSIFCDLANFIILYHTVKPGKCNPDQFRCLNGECIKSILVCDEVADCADHSDEGSLAECRE
mgnify:CR=1 FL=1